VQTLPATIDPGIWETNKRFLPFPFQIALCTPHVSDSSCMRSLLLVSQYGIIGHQQSTKGKI
jgi:hypothetical protein